MTREPQIQPNFAVPTYLHTCARVSARARGTAVHANAMRGGRSASHEVILRVERRGRASSSSSSSSPRNQHGKVRSCNIHGSGVASRKRRPLRTRARVNFQLQSFWQRDAKERRTRSGGSPETAAGQEIRTDSAPVVARARLGVFPPFPSFFLSVSERSHRVVDQDAAWATLPQGIHCGCGKRCIN